MSAIRVARLLLPLAAVALSACQYGMPVVNSPADVAPGKIVLVGKVVLDPPLERGEQSLGAGEKSQENLINLLTSAEQEMIDPENLRYRDYKTAIKAPLGKEFFVIAPYSQANITGAMLYLNAGDNTYFPGGWRYAASAGDKAIYLGTIRYHRNDFYEIVGREIVDEYSKANAEFMKKFGTSMKLKKALLRPVK